MQASASARFRPARTAASSSATSQSTARPTPQRRHRCSASSADRARMAKKKTGKPSFIPVDEDDLAPAHRWHRPLQAPGTTQVDFKERVDFRRLHRYRLARTRQALAASGLGAVLCFDQHNIRYISSTVIGEWARDKLIRYCLLSGTGEPWVWDFGSAARHHKLYCPWLKEDHVRAGNPGMRGAIGPKVGLFEQAAKEIKDILVQEGVAGMPLGLDGCEPGMLLD